MGRTLGMNDKPFSETFIGRNIALVVCMGYLFALWTALWAVGPDIAADAAHLRVGICKHPRWEQGVAHRWHPCNERNEAFEPRLARK